MNADKQIADILSRHGEDFRDATWRVQGQAVIYHKALERIAVQASITFDVPTIIRAERDEAVMLVVGRMGDRLEWSVGECVVNVNYRVSGRQAAYVWAMAEKRAKDRVILKLINLHGLLYSEEEADDFKPDARPNGAEPPAGPVKSSRQAKKDDDWTKVTGSLAACEDSITLLNWPLVNADLLKPMPRQWQDEVEEAWRIELAGKLATECQSVREAQAWATENAKRIEALPPMYLGAARDAYKAHVREPRP